MSPTKEQVMQDLKQGVDLRAKEQVEKIKGEYQLIHECAEEWEKVCIKNKLSIAQMNQVWSALIDRQDRLVKKALVEKTIRPNLNIVDQRTGQPINI